MACAMTMCGVMLESILETASRFVSPVVEADFIFNCQRFCQGYAILTCFQNLPVSVILWVPTEEALCAA